MIKTEERGTSPKSTSGTIQHNALDSAQVYATIELSRVVKSRVKITRLANPQKAENVTL